MVGRNVTGSDTPDRTLDRDTQLRLLLEVDALLPAGPPIPILLVGGAALAVHWGDRFSMDVDIVAPGLPDEVLNVARVVAAKHGIAETWLENPFEVAPRLEPAPDLVASGQRINIYVPCLEYILAMKLYASRLKDAADTARLISETGRLSRRQLTDLLNRAYPNAPKSELRQAFLENALADAISLMEFRNLVAEPEPEEPQEPGRPTP